jgi:hypothetical protein
MRFGRTRALMRRTSAQERSSRQTGCQFHKQRPESVARHFPPLRVEQTCQSRDSSRAAFRARVEMSLLVSLRNISWRYASRSSRVNASAVWGRASGWLHGPINGSFICNTLKRNVQRPKSRKYAIGTKCRLHGHSCGGRFRNSLRCSSSGAFLAVVRRFVRPLRRRQPPGA